MWWIVGLLFACLVSAAAFILGWRASTLPDRYRRFLFAFAALASLVTAFLLALTGLFLMAYAGYCGDANSTCAPDSWRPLGLAVLGAAGAFVFLLVKSVRAVRRLG
jgi:hypothetical protein